jgi:mannose-6-phosphate isomerase-like protein (cupin superfamily)/predicted enzyme related to lactoylglutathione lyase
MSRVGIRASLMLAGWCAATGMALAQSDKPAAKAVPLQQKSAGYQELLSGPPTSAGMKSGLVVLAPGKSVGKHSTGDHEEMVIVLEGAGQMVLADGKRIEISPAAAAYSPPGTEHDVINTGSGLLRYIYVVSEAGPKPSQAKQKGAAMERVTGLGGVFLKANDPKAQYAWYEKHLGIKAKAEDGGAMFHWRYADDPEKSGMTVWSMFPENTKYFGTGNQAQMLNYIVDDLDALLEALKAEGVNVDPKVERMEYGKFGWITDPEGNRIELWEPPKEKK